MIDVSAIRVGEYQPDAINRAIAQLLAPLGGMAAFVKPGQRVLIKPNMLAGKPPERAVTTHPLVVRSVIEAAQAAGGVVSVGDSPGVGKPVAVALKCGIMEVIEQTGARFAPFTDSVQVECSGKTFHRLELARDILETDVIINLPKLKTHQMMGLTCGVKNLFGAVVGLRKPRLHLQAGTDKDFFALMLLELSEFIAPNLTLVDAVVGMEGDGPGGGDPVAIGCLLASGSPVAVDTIAAEIVGLRQDSIWTQKVARGKGLDGAILDDINLVGTQLSQLKIENFRPSKTTDVNFGLPPFIKTRLKRSLTAYPRIDRAHCRLCNDCVRHCPPEAMRQENSAVIIDYDRCIRCFCCQELCSHKAVETEQGWLLRATEFLQGKG
ncbi:MAG: (4Fe-4S)-binding protein [Desulfuromonas sp.]|nr:MAG: (4Fe-4S)-binding protein [Desulfuromonas sp.]